MPKIPTRIRKSYPYSEPNIPDIVRANIHQHNHTLQLNQSRRLTSPKVASLLNLSLYDSDNGHDGETSIIEFEL